MTLIPNSTIDALRRAQDLSVENYGIPCTLYIPNNLTTLEPNDVYTNPDDITYDEYTDQKVWIEWYAKDLYKLRKMGVFAEHELPVLAYFKNSPIITIKSYITVPMRYVPDSYGVENWEVVEAVMQGTYSSQTLTRFKMAPLRKPTVGTI